MTEKTCLRNWMHTWVITCKDYLFNLNLTSNMEVLYVKYVNMNIIMEIVIFLSEWEEIENLTILPTHVLIQHKILKNNDAYLVDILLVSEACGRKKMGLLSLNDAVPNNLILR